jgi:hypothetical protein
MFALKSPMVFSCVPIGRTRRKIYRTIRGYYTLDKRNSKPLDKVVKEGLFHVIAFIRDGDTGLYSVTEKDEDDVPRDSIVAFRTFEDAFRYKTLLDADMKIASFVQFASRYELEHACNVGGYDCLVVDDGALVTPPSEDCEDY